MIARSRSRRSAAIHPLIFLVAFTALLLAPMLGAVAQSDPVRTSPTETPSSPDGFQAQPTEEPTREPEPPPTEAPDAPTEEAQPAAPSSLTLHKGACDDSGFDPLSAQGLDTFLDACHSPDGEFEFTVFNNVSFNVTQSTELGTLFLQIPTGPVTITETIPAGWADPAVFCWSNLFPSPAAQPFIGNSPVWDVAEGEDVECWWFNIAAGDGPDAPDTLLDPGLLEGEAQLAHDVTITKRTCPAGTDPTQALDAYQNLCPTMAGIEFTLEFGGGATSTTVTDANGEISWFSVVDGPFELRETNHAAYTQQVAFCHYDGVGAPWQGIVIDGAMAGTFDMGLPPGTGSVHLFCEWINFESDTSATLMVIKHRCPLGVPEDATLDQYLVICTALFDGVTFTLDHPGGSFPGVTANGGEVEWADVPAGPVTLTETIPGGYQDPRVFCHFFQGEQELLAGQEEVSLGGVIPLVVPHDATDIVCWVINIPNPDANSVTVIKWLCPEGFDRLNDDHYAECTEPFGGVTFTLGDMEATTGDDQGVAIFPDVPPGDHQLIEIMPDGIAFGWIDMCTLNDGLGVIPIGDEGPPAVQITVETGDHWVCEVYNVREEDEENTITIRKWHCPEGTPLDQSREWYGATCIAQHDGVLFSIASDLGVAAAPTMGGVVQFDMLPAGGVGIQEQIPDGFGPPIVFCDTNGNWQSYPAPTGHWSLDFPDDHVSEDIFCYVFNIPGEDPDLTILKWTCPEGYDLHAWGADPHADCTQATNGVEFELRYSGHDEVEQSQVTGDVIDGGVRFEDLQPDLYQVSEIVPAGIDSVFILECTGHIMGVLQPYPLESGNVLDDIDLDAGEHLICHWFNVPEPDGGSLVVIKYTCATETFVSEVECQIEEDGVTFSLLHWNPGTGQWDTIDTAVTDGFGRITWPSLDAGDYSLDEHNGDWCHLETSPVFGPGDGFSIIDDTETMVEVYNCDGTPGIPGEIPTKYPNTGVPRESTPVLHAGLARGRYTLAA